MSNIACVRCGEIFPFTEDYFCKNKKCKCGLSRVCKKCRSRKQRLYQEQNSEKIKSRKKEYYDNHKAEIALKQKLEQIDRKLGVKQNV